MRDKVRQSIAFRHVHQKQVSYVAAKEQKPGLISSGSRNITFGYFRHFVCLKKKIVNSSVLSFSLKLFRTKVDIKSIIRDD